MENQWDEAMLNVERSCCFTGHRPEKLKTDPKEVFAGLKREIQQAIDDGYDTFLTGMARGVDLWAAHIVLEKKAQYPQLKLYCAIPYAGFEKRWDERWRNAYQQILGQADGAKVFCATYTYGSFDMRNHWMVDHSRRVIAVYNHTHGGTYNTLKYAKKKGVEVFLIEG
ncbi:MAG: DUF1273 family protein [Clostridiales bacterium]|nr:DUF1273 family protein [Clostridiales bacterium]